MVGIRLIIIMAIVGGLIAYIADKMGTKIGKKRLSVFGLRPKHTSILLTVTGGTLIAVTTIAVMAISSESARTALFGMDKLQKELKSLASEKTRMLADLDMSKAMVDAQNKKIGALATQIEASTKANNDLEANIAMLNGRYADAQAEVANLTETKGLLTTEIQDLEKTTEELRKGLVNLREGQVFYRAGEVVYTGVMRSGLKHAENEMQVSWLLSSANQAALRRLHLEQGQEDLQVIWLHKDLVAKAVETLDKSKGNMLFRVRTVANIIVGELAVCDIEMVENQFIYPNNTLILSVEYDLTKNNLPHEGVLMNFLSQLNHDAVQAGVLPDPLTGKVGNMDAATVLEASEAMRRANGKFLLNAYAKGDITTAGPVLVRLEVVPKP